jgi:predicted alpha-1,2-mannosidase
MNSPGSLKSGIRIVFQLMVVLLCSVTSLFAQDYVDYVNMNIGAISHMLRPTYQTIHLPNSMLRMIPIHTPGFTDPYVSSKLYGFPLNISGHRGAYVSSVMASAGEPELEPALLASEYDHDFMTVTPYYYSVVLEDSYTRVEFTPAERSGYYRFGFESTDSRYLVFRCKQEAEINVIDASTIEIIESLPKRGPGKVKQYAYIHLNRPFQSGKTFKDSLFTENKGRISGKGIGIVLNFAPAAEDIDMKYGVSYISTDQAMKNVDNEIPGWSFGNTMQRAKNIWNEALGKISVSGGSEDDRVYFYTSLYRTYERMVNITEDGRYFSGYDNRVHVDDRNFYVDDWGWDTYRSHHPLRILMDPDMQMDIIASYIRMYQQSGWMPQFPKANGSSDAMIGHNPAFIVADAWFKGLRDYDIETAYEGLLKDSKHGTMVPWRSGAAIGLDDFYREHGYFPGLDPDEEETVPEVDDFESRQSVAVTLEHSYSDWCLARLAESLGKKADAELLYNKAEFYRNVYNPETGFMSPKKASGEWVEPFDPKRSGGFGSRDYFAEINAYTYSFHVQHDIYGLIDLMGGNDGFVQKLDRLFNEPHFGIARWTWFSQNPDGTGLVGQYVAGNEPSFHVPYLYVYAGAPWKTQKRLRQLMQAWFRNDLMGVCGDDDGGALTSYYVFTAMGFYPVCPGSPIYIIGSPLFEHSLFQLKGGKEFQITAVDNSPQNKYIQSASLNGESINRAWISHDEVVNGGTLILHMGPRPNKSWGIEEIPVPNN